jgi:AraC-like DNA-binding protein
LCQSGVSLIDFRSWDPEETRAHTLRYGDHHRVVHGSGNFLYSECAAATGRIALGHIHRAFRQSLHATARRATLFLNLYPGETVRTGRRRSFELDPFRAVVIPADWEYTNQGFAFKGLGMSVDAGLLESAIDAQVSGRSRRWIPQAVSVPMSRERRAELVAMLEQLRASAGRGGARGPQDSVAALDQAAAGWMAESLLEASGVIAVRDASLHRLARLTRWIDQNLAEDITLDRMCAVVGVSWRSLQRTMLAVHGQTPLEFVNARRLAAARILIEGRSSRAQIGTIALDCGFRHFGRFSAAYRQAFGELPSATMAAAGTQNCRPGRSPA